MLVSQGTTTNKRHTIERQINVTIASDDYGDGS